MTCLKENRRCAVEENSHALPSYVKLDLRILTQSHQNENMSSFLLNDCTVDHAWHVLYSIGKWYYLVEKEPFFAFFYICQWSPHFTTSTLHKSGDQAALKIGRVCLMACYNTCTALYIHNMLYFLDILLSCVNMIESLHYVPAWTYNRVSSGK